MSDKSQDNSHELAQTMAEVQYRHSQAAEALASHRADKAEYHLFKAFSALGDYLIEDDWEPAPAEDADITEDSNDG